MLTAMLEDDVSSMLDYVNWRTFARVISLKLPNPRTLYGTSPVAGQPSPYPYLTHTAFIPPFFQTCPVPPEDAVVAIPSAQYCSSWSSPCV